MDGKITVIAGPMFSEKSGELCSRCIKEENFGRKRVIAFKPFIDDRFSSRFIKSRVGLEFPAIGLPNRLTANVYEDIIKACKTFDIVAFDEAQFFSEKIVPLINQLAMLGKEVLVAGLTTDYRGEPFGYIGNLICLADEVLLLKAYCSCCGKPAQFTYRKVKSSEKNLIGDTKEYEPRCRKCFMEGVEANA